MFDCLNACSHLSLALNALWVSLLYDSDGGGDGGPYNEARWKEASQTLIHYQERESSEQREWRLAREREYNKK